MYQHGGDIYHHLNCIDFSANINFLGLPEPVKEALEEGIGACEHYPDVRMEKLRELIAKREGVLPEQIICGNGAAELIFLLAAALRPKKAILLAPGFQEYEQALSFYGCEICFYDLKEENGFLPGEDLEDRIDDSVDMMFLCNPNNPTGVLMDSGWMERIVERCSSTGTTLVVDECFLDFIDDEEELSVRRFLPDHPNLFVIRAFTKIFAMPGLRLGYGICSNEETLRKMRAGCQPWNVSVPAQKAGCVAAELQEYVEETRRLLKLEKSWLILALEDLSLQIYGSAANYIFFRGPEDLGEQLESKGFLMRDCSNYRGLTKGFYRIAVRARLDNEELICAMRECLEVK